MTMAEFGKPLDVSCSIEAQPAGDRGKAGRLALVDIIVGDEKAAWVVVVAIAVAAGQAMVVEATAAAEVQRFWTGSIAGIPGIDRGWENSGALLAVAVCRLETVPSRYSLFIPSISISVLDWCTGTGVLFCEAQ